LEQWWLLVGNRIFAGVNQKSYSISFALSVATVFIFILCALFAPRWETNDDVAMSMIAHGYGGVSAASHKLIFSNVIWGDLVRFLPEIHGVLGYSTATLMVLLITGAVLLYSFRAIEAGIILSVSSLILLLARPILFPQFTINAGLLTISAILLFHLYAREKNWVTLSLGVLLAFFGYCVRAQEFFLVFLVALPLLPWRTLIQERAPKIALVVLALAIVVAVIYHKQAYDGVEWESFHELEVPRSVYSDFGAVDRLKDQPEIYKEYHYSVNDLDLLENWFYVDPKIANPVAMNEMLEKLGPVSMNKTSFKNARRGVRALYNPILLPAVLSALALFMLWPNKKVAGAWLLCIASVGIIGFLGRPAILRVYIPLTVLLCIAPLIMAPLRSDRRRMLATMVILIAALINTVYLMIDAKKSEKKIQQVNEALAEFPSYPVVVWGASLPYEYLYPVLGASPRVKSYEYYGLGTFTLAPFSLAYSEQKAGRGMIDLLLTEQGINIFSGNHSIALLSTYCGEHFGGTLKISNTQVYPDLGRGVILANYRCET
jgi:uncharacterized membrane protein (DUF485 family)